MEKGCRRAVCQKLIEIAKKQGYVTFDDIMDCATDDFDWLCDYLATLGILIYDEEPANAYFQDDVYEDFAQSDYDEIYERVVAYSPSLEPLVDFIKNVVPPQRGEVKQLKYQVAVGNQCARQRMIELHLHLALRIALHRSEAYDLDIEEAVGDACIGLINAVDSYDPDTYKHFTPYATFWIIRNIIREQRAQIPLNYFPETIMPKYLKMYQFLKRYGCIGCNEIQSCEKALKKVLDKLKCNEQRAKLVISQMVPDVRYDVLIERFEKKYKRHYDVGSLFAKLSTATIIEEEDAFKSVHDNYMREVIEQQLETIPPREAFVLKESFGLNGKEKTLKEIGKILERSGGRVGQLRNRGLRRMRHPKRFNRLIVFMD